MQRRECAVAHLREVERATRTLLRVMRRKGGEKSKNVGTLFEGFLLCRRDFEGDVAAPPDSDGGLLSVSAGGARRREICTPAFQLQQGVRNGEDQRNEVVEVLSTRRGRPASVESDRFEVCRAPL